MAIQVRSPCLRDRFSLQVPEAPGATKHYTFTDFRFYKATSPLVDSGLLGPVNLVSVEQGK